MVAALAAAIAFSGVPQNAVVEATSASGAVYSYAQPTASEEGRSVPVSCTPASGSTFALGRTVVTCSAVDSSGARGSTDFGVTVQDTTPPALHLPRPITVDATSARGARVDWTVSATDVVDGRSHVSCSDSSGELFPIGRTPVMCVANDTRSNDSLGTFVVTVRGAPAEIGATLRRAPLDAALELRRAETALRRGSRGACVHVRAFAALVRSRPALLAAGRRIESVLGCR